MDQLPLELLQRVFTHLDVETLRNVALSCRTFFDAFKAAEELITGEALLRQVNYDVLPEAILVSKSRNLGKPSVSKGIKFAENLRHREPAPTRWKLADALPLAQFHSKVTYLAKQAADEALQKQPRLLAKGEPAAPTCEEMYRFERALYRFQLYCNVVGHLFPVEEEELQDIFFDHFATWELEQLACIFEHLVRVVSRPFNYLVEHDVTWGYLRVPYIDPYHLDDAQYILAEGVEVIYRLSQASGYTQWHALLSRGEDMFDEPFGLAFFLTEGLGRPANPFMMPLVSLSEMDEEEKELVVNKPFYRDPDPGPASMWEWVYRDHIPSELVANSDMAVHRQWAFPFWNSSRLMAAGLLGDLEIPGPRNPNDPELEKYNTPARQEFLEETRRERTDIWKRGGYGYWSHNDLSQVKWRDNDPPQVFSSHTYRGIYKVF
ncbi:hypothetical protein F4818DRAFT_420286 [Hypoxylon cercidicola]|nr:hypothetical protein F4818DRAFT_420286 [Hypoxylon cercidicola]